MSDDVANTVPAEEKIAAIRELNADEIASVGGGRFKQYEPYTPPDQEPFNPLPEGHSKHKINY